MENKIVGLSYCAVSRIADMVKFESFQNHIQIAIEKLAIQVRAATPAHLLRRFPDEDKEIKVALSEILHRGLTCIRFVINPGTK